MNDQKERFFRGMDWIWLLVIVILALFALDVLPPGVGHVGQEPPHPGPPFKVGFARAYDSWTDPQAHDSISLVTWLDQEAHLVCNMMDSMRQAGQSQGFPVPVDLYNFCKDGSTGDTDPTRPPPQPECDWGNCPEE